MDDVVLQVSECVDLMNQTLDYAYPTIVVEGEVSGFKINRDKFVFFDLKDENANLSCFMMVFHLNVPLEDGMRIVIKAKPKVTKWSKLSLTVMQIQPVGEGSIKRNFELLKQKLAKEGLFAPERKRMLPQFPEKIGVVASIESAGYADFLKILNQRWKGVDISVVDTQVQGMDAPNQLINSIQHMNQNFPDLEVLVIVRGGGSLEDLQAFNDEQLTRVIAASKIPTLVGVGHEVDVTLADLVSDVRASTPSNAAELLVPDVKSVISELSANRARLSQLLKFESIKERVQLAAEELDKRAINYIARMTELVRSRQRLLASYNPEAALQRGYAVAKLDNTIIRSVSQVKLKDRFSLSIIDGIIEGEVTDVKKS